MIVGVGLPVVGLGVVGLTECDGPGGGVAGGLALFPGVADELPGDGVAAAGSVVPAGGEVAEEPADWIGCDGETRAAVPGSVAAGAAWCVPAASTRPPANRMTAAATAEAASSRRRVVPGRLAAATGAGKPLARNFPARRTT